MSHQVLAHEAYAAKTSPVRPETPGAQRPTFPRNPSCAVSSVLCALTLPNDSFARATHLTHFQSCIPIASVNESFTSVNDSLELVSHLPRYQYPARGYHRTSPTNLFRINHHPAHAPPRAQGTHRARYPCRHP
jgi:hypothetical protein